MVRPHVSEDTVDRLDDVMRGILHVSPERVSFEEKVQVLLSEYEDNSRSGGVKVSGGNWSGGR